jgi:hypothetical protein
VSRVRNRQMPQPAVRWQIGSKTLLLTSQGAAVMLEIMDRTPLQKHSADVCVVDLKLGFPSYRL